MGAPLPDKGGRVLEELRRLSERLAQRYAWDEAQATTFVLTDAVPLVSTVKLRPDPARNRGFGGRDPGLPC